MKTLTLLLVVGVTICIFAQQSSHSNNTVSSADSSTKFVSLPREGFSFDSIQAMESFAAKSSPGGGSVQEMVVGGQPVFVVTRSVSLGGSTVEITFFKKSFDRYVCFLAMPLSYSEFRVEQVEDGILLSRSEHATKKRVRVLAIYQLP